jgi:hypothetical protein
MALRQPAAPAPSPTLAPSPAASAPSPFEADETDVTTVAEPNTASANEPTTQASVPAPSFGTRALAPRSAEAESFAQEVEAMRGACDFSYGNYPVFKGNNGEIIGIGDNKAKLGRWIKVAMIGWDEHFEVSPGADDKEAKDFVGYSKDGITLDRCIGEMQHRQWSGKAVKDYVQHLHTVEQYDKADSRRFIDVGCILLESENDEGMQGEVIQVTLSQSSIPSFSQYQERLIQKARAAARGIPGVKVPEDPFTFYFLRELAEQGSNKWTKLRVVDKLPAKI